MSNNLQPDFKIDGKSVNTDASGRTRVSLMSTLFDGKTLNQEDSLIWENIGTGSFLFDKNKTIMSAENGQYQIRRGRHIINYFSGKSTLMELTFDNFAPQEGITKRAGYFSSNSTSEYELDIDGFMLESSDGNVSLRIFNDGSIVADIPLDKWDEASYFKGYDFNKFTIVMFDFLWLGGSELRMFIKTQDGFILAHTYVHAGAVDDTFIKSPNHSIRYEIRSESGFSGSMRSICSQVSTEGAIPDDGKSLALVNYTSLSVGSIGNIYALKGVKKTALNRDIFVSVIASAVVNTGTNDTGMILVIINPTLSAPLSYVANSKVLDGTALAGTTITQGSGRIIASIPANSTGQESGINNTILASIAMNIDNTSDEIVLAYMPTSANQSVNGILTIKEY